MITPHFVSMSLPSSPRQTHSRLASSPGRQGYCLGYTLVEITVALSIILVISAMALPRIDAAVANYRMRAAVSAVSGAIQATRYRAIYEGCSTSISLNKASGQYQISHKLSNGSCASTFSPIGNPIGFAAAPIQLGQDTTLQFNPGGSVAVLAGSATLTLSSGTLSETIQVSNYGNITVTP